MRLVLAAVVAAIAVGVYALSASGEEPAPREETAQRERPAAVVEQAELPPLPEMRPTVVEPEAGDTGAAAPSEPDPGLTEAGPKPTQPASAGAHPSRVGRTDITKANALPNGVALPPLEAPEEVKQIIEAGNIIARSPYKWGGGHGEWLDDGYDCSGSVSFALAAAGLLDGPARLRAADELGRARQGQVGDDLHASPATCSWRSPGSGSTRRTRASPARAGATTCARRAGSSPAIRRASEAWGPHPMKGADAAADETA